MFKRAVIKIIVVALALFLAEKIIPGLEIADFWVAVWAALILGVINITIRPIVCFLTLPITFLTLGLFTFVINGVFFLLVAHILEGFYVEGFLTALLGSIVTSVISSLISSLLDKKYR
ncbi:phage holin family protein [Desulfuribacillus alkaliarsenatis]|uniref:Phage holin family protein n=1 Tax=Desulfuribacillus alkaliarsenatis TaxID=766136 RepID=A0A1E5G565_9FIRM|nr:phage holin family protein [Desulfuribacillus alkaliarsenatis]OEF97833.1 hypothetical protein BHF68_13455 [Desulfuribacillus alkaliarsenatis]